MNFKLDETTHRGISDLSRAVMPAMLYILLYLTDIIGKITRSTDKRVFYVKQNVETNVAKTMIDVKYTEDASIEEDFHAEWKNIIMYIYFLLHLF